MKFNGRNVHISKKARIGRNVKIGDNSAIYDHVEIGDNSIVCNDTVIGEPLTAYYHDSGYENPPTVIGSDSLIRSHSIIYAGCTIGRRFSSGHRVTIRENTIMGECCSIGTLSDIQANVLVIRYPDEGNPQQFQRFDQECFDVIPAARESLRGRPGSRVDLSAPVCVLNAVSIRP